MSLHLTGLWTRELLVIIICNSKKLFEYFYSLQVPQQVTVGDGHKLEAVGTGVVTLKLKLLEGESTIRRLSCSLCAEVSLQSTEHTTSYGATRSHILDDQRELVAMASKTGSLYYLNSEPLAKP